MALIFKNKTSSAVIIQHGTLGVEIPANDQADLSATFEPWQLMSCQDLFQLVAQGVDKYQIDDCTSDLMALQAVLSGMYPLMTPSEILSDAKTIKKSNLDNDSVSFQLTRYNSNDQTNLLNIYNDSLRIRPNRASYIEPWVEWRNEIATEVKNKKALVDAATTIPDVNAVTLDVATLTAHDPGISVSGALAIVDDITLEDYINENARVTDPVTSISGPYSLMQLLLMRKDLYNDNENPLFEAGFVPILGADGILIDHVDRIANLENIHSKIGWHEQQVMQALYKGPKDLLIYYGYPNSFNSATNGWNNESVAQDMAKYSLIVLGDGVEAPSHPDYANTQIIIPRIKALNPNALIFGYVAVAQTLVNFQSKVDQWNTLAVHGIFMDEAGYDFGKTRAEFNTCVDYVHGKTHAKLCFANAWNTDHVLGTTNDVSYPNSTYNAGLIAS